MKNKIKLQSFYNDILEGEENNYESFLGYCSRPMKLEIVLETAEDAEDLISFLNKVKAALIKQINKMEDKYIGIKEATPNSNATNKDRVFTIKQDGFYYDDKGRKFTKNEIKHDLEKGYLKEL